MVGSTTIGARLDPEDFRDVIAAYHRCVTEEVARVGGFTARYTGDGVLSYFGYPLANENDAESAVRAGIAAVEAVAALETVAGSPGTLRARVGIATGVVIAGHVIHAGELLQKTVVSGRTGDGRYRREHAAPYRWAVRLPRHRDTHHQGL
jgi:class 3 adenylate cyclase